MLENVPQIWGINLRFNPLSLAISAWLNHWIHISSSEDQEPDSNLPSFRKISSNLGFGVDLEIKFNFLMFCWHQQLQQLIFIRNLKSGFWTDQVQAKSILIHFRNRSSTTTNLNSDGLEFGLQPFLKMTWLIFTMCFFNFLETTVIASRDKVTGISQTTRMTEITKLGLGEVRKTGSQVKMCRVSTRIYCFLSWSKAASAVQSVRAPAGRATVPDLA